MNSRQRAARRYPEGRWLFATWTLHGVLPAWRFPTPAKTTSTEAFSWVDAYLDSRRSGPAFLAEDAVAQIVVDSLQRGAKLEHYQLGPFAVMPNHVHALFLPLVSPNRFLKSLKGSAGRDANRLLDRTGQPFWQRESYDRWVRSAEERSRIAKHIEQNPVRAGLVAAAGDYPWSSACVGLSQVRGIARIPA